MNVDANTAGLESLGPRTVAVLAWPQIRDPDDYQPLLALSKLSVIWVRNPEELEALVTDDWIVLPDSSDVGRELSWIRRCGLDRAIVAHAARGGTVLGIGAGLPMLGEALIDPQSIDGNAPGLGLLPLVTVLTPARMAPSVRVRFATGLATGTGPWAALAGVEIAGRDIRHGRTGQHAGMATAGDRARDVLPPGLGWTHDAGQVLGISVQGLFANPAVMNALLDTPIRKP